MIKTIFLSFLFLPCVYTDIKKYEIPVGYTVLLGIAALGFRTIAEKEMPVTFISAVLLTCLFLAFSYLSKGIGAGDAFLTGAVICVFGIYTALKGIFLGMLLTALSGSLCMVIKKDRSLKLPFAPFLISGIILGIVIDYYHGGVL